MPIADFETLCETTYEPVANAAFLIVGDRHEALDITQEAFSRALERWDKVADMSNPQGWVFRVAVNLALSRRRAVRRFVRGVPDEPVPQVDAPDPALAQALRRLSPAQRAAIVSRFYLDLSVDDSAQILGKRPVTVRALTAQGVARLREELGPDCWRRTMNRSFRERLSALADFGSSYTPDRADLERRIARRRRTRRLGAGITAGLVSIAIFVPLQALRGGGATSSPAARVPQVTVGLQTVPRPYERRALDFGSMDCIDTAFSKVTSAAATDAATFAQLEPQGSAVLRAVQVLHKYDDGTESRFPLIASDSAPVYAVFISGHCETESHEVVIGARVLVNQDGQGMQVYGWQASHPEDISQPFGAQFDDRFGASAGSLNPPPSSPPLPGTLGASEGPSPV